MVSLGSSRPLLSTPSLKTSDSDHRVQGQAQNKTCFMLNIALFGPPGAGKGTQSELLLKKYSLFYISTGDSLRTEMAGKTKLGLEAQNIIAAGGLVSDEIIVQLIEKTITENTDSNGFLFDGFPRTYIQAYILEGLMLKQFRPWNSSGGWTNAAKLPTACRMTPAPRKSLSVCRNTKPGPCRSSRNTSNSTGSSKSTGRARSTKCLRRFHPELKTSLRT
jgi:hypothetical protein